MSSESRSGGERRYTAYVAGISTSASRDAAMSFAIGGDFHALGLMQRWLLLERGLQSHHAVLDVGCGSGRTAHALADLAGLRYIGVDVVPDLLEYARSACNRPDWSFALAQGFTLPASDATVDYVLFFSVLTHLLHEESFIYLREAARVVKPGGRIIITFLDMSVPLHWEIFAAMVDRYGESLPLNMFVARDWWAVWGRALGLEVEELRDGSEPYVTLQHDLVLESGQVYSERATLGQSLCVYRKPG